jgi:hypothetical protein
MEHIKLSNTLYNNNNMAQSSTNSADVAPDFMSNRQIKHVIVVKDGVNLEAEVSDTPATKFNDGKPKWLYDSGATEVTEGHADNRLPRTELLQDGSLGKVYPTINKGGSFKGWTEINRKRNWEQTKVNCSHCHKLYSRASLPEHHKTSKCVNAEGRRFQVGVDTPDVMTYNQTNITVKTNNGTDITTIVTDTPATHYDCGKPKWRYASGATEVTAGHPDNMLPKTALEKTGEFGIVHDPKNTDDLKSGNYNTDGTFKGWTAINKANNKRQSKIMCHHCKTLVCDGSLSKHQRSAKCVNADGRRFQVGVDPTKINADGTEVLGRMRRGDAPVKKTFTCEQDGFATLPLDWAGAEAHFAQLPRETLAKMLVGQLAHINSDVTSHDIRFNFTDDVLAPADYKPSTHGQRSQMATELATTHDKFTAWESTLESDKKLLQARAMAMMTNGDFDATKLIMEEQTKLAALGATYSAKMEDLESKLANMDAAQLPLTSEDIPALQSYNVANETPMVPITSVKPRKKRAPVKKPVAPTAEVVSDTEAVGYSSDDEPVE